MKDIARSKLGCNFIRNSQTPWFQTGLVLPAIPLTHSVLIEAFISSNIMDKDDWIIGNPAGAFYIRRIALTPKNVIEFSVIGGGVSIPVNMGLMYLAFLVDRTNTRAKSYVNGSLQDDRVLVDPVTNVVWTLWLGAGGYSYSGYTLILGRLTTLTSVPASINSDIKWMYQFPMHGLAQGIQTNLGAIASEWSFEDQILNSITILDTGQIAGYPLTSTVNVQTLMKIVEKC